jgi:hypothetical protein
MAPLIVMLVSWLVARSIGVSGMWYQAALWTGALRIALAAMFVFTAVSHFHPRTRPDLIRNSRRGLSRRRRRPLRHRPSSPTDEPESSPRST